MGSRIPFAPGCLDVNETTACKSYDGASVKNVSSTADYTIICVGNGELIESEIYGINGTQSDVIPGMRLPGYQEELVQDAMAVSKKVRSLLSVCCNVVLVFISIGC